MKYASDIVMHFLGRAHRDDPVAQVETCISILSQGFRFTEQVVDLGQAIGGDDCRLTTNAVCFTDIPLRLSGPQVARYGTCAIGISKSLVKRWGGNPVLYLVDTKVSPASKPRTDFRGVFGQDVALLLKLLNIPDLGAPLRSNADHWFNAYEALPPAQRESLRNTLNNVLIPYLKGMFDLGPDVDAEDESARRDRYYMEREWRVVLTARHRAHAEGIATVVIKRDDSYYLPIPRRDVRVVVVPNWRSRNELLAKLLDAGWAQDELPPTIEYGDSVDL